MTTRHSAVSPLYATMLAMAAIGFPGIRAGKPWLFPSLGPTIFLQVATPDQPAARPWNTLIGHAIWVAAGVLLVAAFGDAARRLHPDRPNEPWPAPYPAGAAAFLRRPVARRSST